jgi:hypothetical protein
MLLLNFNYLMVELCLTKLVMMGCMQDISQGRFAFKHHYSNIPSFISFDQDDRYSLKCQVEGTNETNINQGFIEPKKEKSLPSRPSPTNPVSKLVGFGLTLQ